MLSNAKQLPNETAYNFLMRLMNLRQRIFFVTKEDPHLYSENLTKERLLHAVFVGLKNENIRHELRPLLKDLNVCDEDLLEMLNRALADENGHIEKTFRTIKSYINEVETLAVTPENPKPEKKENPLIKEFSALKAQVESLSSLRSDFEEFKRLTHRDKSRENRNSRNRCKFCKENSKTRCEHCFVCGSMEHWRACCKNNAKKSKN